ncbi:MAG: hypothetical protein AMXMBFR16_11460 [Candidatus Uhrbacteria bacterium]
MVDTLRLYLHTLQRAVIEASLIAGEGTTDKLAAARLREYADDVNNAVGELVEGFIKGTEQLR